MNNLVKLLSNSANVYLDKMMIIGDNIFRILLAIDNPENNLANMRFIDIIMDTVKSTIMYTIIDKPDMKRIRRKLFIDDILKLFLPDDNGDIINTYIEDIKFNDNIVDISIVIEDEGIKILKSSNCNSIIVKRLNVLLNFDEEDLAFNVDVFYANRT